MRFEGLVQRFAIVTLFSSAVVASHATAAVGASKTPTPSVDDVRLDVLAIADNINALGAILENPALALLAERILASSDETDQLEANRERLGALLRMGREQTGKLADMLGANREPGPVTRSAGFPKPGSNTLYVAGCGSTASRFGVLTAAQAAQTILDAAKFFCEQELPGLPSLSVACIPFSITAVAMRITYDQLDLCDALDTAILHETISSQTAHLHTDHEAHVQHLDQRSTLVDSSVAARTANLNVRADKIDSELAMHQANQTHRTNVIDAEIDDARNAGHGRGRDLRDKIYRGLIEQSLSRYSSKPLALLQLPAAYGGPGGRLGRLEQVRDVVAETIDKAVSVGLSVGNARNYFAAGEQAFAERRYKVAYRFYERAYAQASPRRR